MVAKCKVCGKSIEFPTNEEIFNEDSPLGESFRDLLKNMTCDTCMDAKEERFRKDREAMNLVLLADSIDERMEETGFPEKFQRLEKPFCRDIAEQLWKVRDSHIAITGKTGTGKTSSMALVARKMMQIKELKVRYYTLSSFLSAVNRSKTTDYGEEAFWQFCKGFDILIVDEIAGRRGYENKLSPAGQDSFFNLLDLAYTQTHTKIWIAGNIYAGNLSEMFDDPDPILRRLEESFKKIS